MTTFRALQVRKEGDAQTAAFVTLNESDLTEGNVTVEVHNSSVNYKDGLAVTGKGPIIRKFPLIPGIDFSGVVISSSHPNWKVGDKVIHGGFGVGESFNGGYSEIAKVNGDWLVHLPDAFSFSDAMSIGVAGFTAMLCVMALEEQHITPDRGEIVVTGAAGGVGTIAITLLGKLGYNVVAATGRPEEEAFLKGLGAASIINRAELNTPVKPLAKARWAGAIDNVGSTILANIISQMQNDGTVAACGLAQGMDLPTSVAPFILRGVRLIGINSVTVPEPRRTAVWARLARDLDIGKLRALTTHVKLDDVPQVASDIVDGKTRGRVVVDVK
jgi:acrylyl-CoA reductase (NADPH)